MTNEPTAKKPARADRYAQVAPPRPGIPYQLRILLVISVAIISSIVVVIVLLTWQPGTRITILALVPEAYLLLARAGGLVGRVRRPHPRPPVAAAVTAAEVLAMAAFHLAPSTPAATCCSHLRPGPGARQPVAFP